MSAKRPQRSADIATAGALAKAGTDKALKACPPKLKERRRKILEKLGV